jgi:predicted peroxiredoxin
MIALHSLLVCQQIIMTLPTRFLPLLALCCVVLLSLDASAGEKRTVFYNVTTDETWASGMATGQAAMAMKAGYKVVMFLNVRGVYLVSKRRALDTFSGTGKTARQMLTDLMKGGARVIICPMCLRKAGISESDLLDGVELGGPEVTFPLMTAEDTVVISY